MRRLLSAALLVWLLAGCASRPAESPRQTGEPLALRIVAVNDFHGYLEPPTGGWTPLGPADDGAKAARIAAGGAPRLAAAIDSLRQESRHAIVVSAGDNIGASPLASALFHDEPSVEALGRMGVSLSAVGNHEFDRGQVELLRIANGGCHPEKGCFGEPWRGARFGYLAANVLNEVTGKPLFPPYAIREFEGVKVAFVGVVLRSTPNIVDRRGIAGLSFGDEAAAVNAVVPELRRQGVEAIVVLLHEGGFLRSGARADDDCVGFTGPLVRIVERLDPAIDLVVSGHTHQVYRCRLSGRLVTSAGSYGRLVTAIDLLIDRSTGDVRSATARNVVVDPAQFPSRTDLADFVSGVVERAREPAGRPAGRIGGPFTTSSTAAGESTLGSLVAEAHLAAFRDGGAADVAFTNPGGLRAPLIPRDPAGTVTYGDLFSAQPFGNTLVALTFTGADILRLLERQFRAAPERSWMLQVAGIEYAWDGRRPLGARVVPGSVRVGGKPLDPRRDYRVVVNSFLHGGGDGFGPFRSGRDPAVGSGDLDALERYLAVDPPRTPARPGRIRRVDVP